MTLQLVTTLQLMTLQLAIQQLTTLQLTTLQLTTLQLTTSRETSNNLLHRMIPYVGGLNIKDNKYPSICINCDVIISATALK